jgi:hypothetical protein
MCPSSHAAGFGHSQRRQSQAFGPPERTDTRHHKPPPQRRDIGRSATPPSRSRQWQSAAASPVRSPGRSAPPEIRPCAAGALPSGRVEAPRRGAGGGTVICICRHAQDSQPGDQGGCGHSTALSASPCLVIHDVLATGSDCIVAAAVPKLNSPFLARWVSP